MRLKLKVWFVVWSVALVVMGCGFGPEVRGEDDTTGGEQIGQAEGPPTATFTPTSAEIEEPADDPTATPIEEEPTSPPTDTPTATATLIEEPTETPTPTPTATSTPTPTFTPTFTPTSVDEPGTVSVSGVMQVYFLDVGQGDATLLVGPDFTFLIDAGRHNASDIVPYLEQYGVDELDLLVGTHPHADHIGQMDRVLAEMSVGEVWMSGDDHTTDNYGRVIDAIIEAQDAWGTVYHEPRVADGVYEIGASTVEILNPLCEPTGDLHDSSVSLRIVFDDVAFLFTGDAEENTEKRMMELTEEIPGYRLEADVYQVGHHGSRTSSSQEFLDEMNPSLAIWSASEGNQHGHPHDQVIDRFAEMDVEAFGTADCGTMAVTAVAGSLWMEADDPTCEYARPADYVQMGVVSQAANVRAGPSTDYARVGTENAGTLLWALGVTEARDWKLVRTESGRVGWMSNSLVDYVETHLLPVVVTPTPRPVETLPEEVDDVIADICLNRPGNGGGTSGNGIAESVDINTASISELQEIIHIGAERAQAMIQLRPFSSVEDMVRIDGIGPSRLADIVEQGVAYAGETSANSEEEPENGCAPGQIDINTASVQELEEIIHIGPARAQDMIESRPFSSVEDMTRISGIAASRLVDIKSQGVACVQ